jgi:hypothetical protein
MNIVDQLYRVGIAALSLPHAGVNGVARVSESPGGQQAGAARCARDDDDILDDHISIFLWLSGATADENTALNNPTSIDFVDCSISVIQTIDVRYP